MATEEKLASAVQKIKKKRIHAHGSTARLYRPLRSIFTLFYGSITKESGKNGMRAFLFEGADYAPQLTIVWWFSHKNPPTVMIIVAVSHCIDEFMNKLAIVILVL